MSQLLSEFLEEKYGKIKNPDETLVHFVQCPHCHLSTWLVDSDEIKNTCDRCGESINEYWGALESGYITTEKLFWENKIKPFTTCKDK